MRSTARLAVAVVVLLAGCRAAPRPAEPSGGGAGTVSPPTTPRDVTPPSPPRHSAADATFMRHMIGHHAQALEMTKLVPSRTTRDDLRLLAERIDVSQRDEIEQMRRWLRARGEAVPTMEAQHHAAVGHHGGMPGMLTADELAALARARGRDFERLFLELMIKHHEGAVTMVKTLFGTQGAAQESETYQIANDIDADQRGEIARMRRLLADLSAQ